MTNGAVEKLGSTKVVIPCHTHEHDVSNNCAVLGTPLNFHQLVSSRVIGIKAKFHFIHNSITQRQ